MFPCEEGINGYYYDEEREYGDDLDGLWGGTRSSRKKLVPSSTFVANSLHFHVPLFSADEQHHKVHETEKAVLYEVQKGKFWVPKALIRGKLVHKGFRRKYLTTGVEDFDVIGD